MVMAYVFFVEAIAADHHGHAWQLEGCCKKINPEIPNENLWCKGGRPRWCVGYVRFFLMFTRRRRSRTRESDQPTA